MGRNVYTIYIQISTQPRISAHPSPLPPTKTPIIRDPPEDGVFFRVLYRNLALLHLRFLLLAFTVLLQNILLHLLRMVKI